MARRTPRFMVVAFASLRAAGLSVRLYEVWVVSSAIVDGLICSVGMAVWRWWYSACREALREPNQTLKRDGTALAWFSAFGRFRPHSAGNLTAGLPVLPLSLVLDSGRSRPHTP